MMPPSSGWGLICSLNYARQMSCRSIWLLKQTVPGEWRDPAGTKEEEIVDAEFWEEK